MYECKLIIRGTLAEIQSIVNLLSDKSDHISVVGPAVGASAQPAPVVEPMERIILPSAMADKGPETVGNVKRVHCKTCGTLFVIGRKRKKFCSPKCYGIDWRDRHSKPGIVPTPSGTDSGVKDPTPVAEVPPPPAPPADRQGKIKPPVNPVKEEPEGKRKYRKHEKKGDFVKPLKSPFKPEKKQRIADNFGGMY